MYLRTSFNSFCLPLETACLYIVVGMWIASLRCLVDRWSSTIFVLTCKLSLNITAKFKAREICVFRIYSFCFSKAHYWGGNLASGSINCIFGAFLFLHDITLQWRTTSWSRKEDKNAVTLRPSWANTPSTLPLLPVTFYKPAWIAIVLRQWKQLGSCLWPSRDYIKH